MNEYSLHKHTQKRRTNLFVVDKAHAAIRVARRGNRPHAMAAKLHDVAVVQPSIGASATLGGYAALGQRQQTLQMAGAGDVIRMHVRVH